MQKAFVSEEESFGVCGFESDWRCPAILVTLSGERLAALTPA